MFYGFFKELKPIAVISMRKVMFGWIFGLNEAKIDQKCSNNPYMVSVIMQNLKGYLCYKMITSQNMSSQAQIKNFLIS